MCKRKSKSKDARYSNIGKQSLVFFSQYQKIAGVIVWAKVLIKRQVSKDIQ